MQRNSSGCSGGWECHGWYVGPSSMAEDRVINFIGLED